MKLKLFLRTGFLLFLCTTVVITHAQGQSAYKSRAEAIAGTSDSANTFAKDLYNVLERQGNVVVSPVSIFTTLSMVSAGAKGQTQAQISNAIYTPPDSLTKSPGMADFIANFKDPDSASVVKEMANYMWVPRGVSIKPEFARTMQEVFQTRVRDADFSRAEDVRQLVNNRISNFTRGKIQELLPRGSITPQTRLLLANAVYFKGQWAIPFDPAETRYDPFVYDPIDSRSSPVPTMRIEDIFRAAMIEELDAKAVLLPYNDNRHGLLLLLPNRYDGLNDLEQKILHTRFTTSRIMQYLIHRGVNLTLPRFQIKYESELSQNLQRIGITDLFTDNADLSGMSSLALRNRLRASGFFHQATIEVNEDGSEASAASGMEITPLMGTTGYTGPIEFKADHPFMFFLIDEINGNVPIFMGRVTQPGNREVAKTRTEDFDIPATPYANRNRYTPAPANDNSPVYTGRPFTNVFTNPVRTTRPSHDEIIFPHAEDPYHRPSLPYRRFDNPLRINSVYPNYITPSRENYEPVLYPGEDDFESPLATHRRRREALPWAWPMNPAAQKWPTAESDSSSNDTIDDRGKKDWHKQPPLVDLLIPVSENPQAAKPSFQPFPAPSRPSFEAPAPPFPAIQAGNRLPAPQGGSPSGFGNNFGNPGWLTTTPNFPTGSGFENSFPGAGNFPYPGFAPTQPSFAAGGPGNAEPFLQLQPGPVPHSPTLGPNAIIFPDPAVRIQPSRTGSRS